MDNQPEIKTPGENSGKLPQFSVGAALREGRELLGLSVADVANRIKFAPRQIEAMEADDFAHLPEMTFVRGFVRSYARLLEIDAAPLLAALPQKHVPLSSVSENKAVEVPFPSMLASRRSNVVWVVATLFVVLALVVFSRMHDSASTSVQPVAQTNVETLELPAGSLAAASAPVADVSPELPAVTSAQPVADKPVVPPRAPVVIPAVKEPVTPTQPVKAPVHAGKDKLAVEKSGQDKVVKETPEKTAKAKTSHEQVTQLPVSTAQKPGAASGLASMRLVFDEDSWADVKDANGKILLSKMNHAGSLVRLSGTAPLSVVIGHASGVQLYFEGKKIDLAPHTSVEVARLVLE